MLGLVRAIGLVVFAIIAVTFLVQNLATIEVAFLTWSISAPRAVVFVMLFVAGLMAGYLLRALRPRQQPTPRRTKGDNIREQEGSPDTLP